MLPATGCPFQKGYDHRRPDSPSSAQFDQAATPAPTPGECCAVCLMKQKPFVVLVYNQDAAAGAEMG